MSESGPTGIGIAADTARAGEAAPDANAGRPFARPVPTDGARHTPARPPAPFVAPGEVERGRAAEREAAVPRAPSAPCAPCAVMIWPAAAEVAAARTLEAVAARLRAGTLRVPFAVAPDVAPAVLATVVAALCAERADLAAEGEPAEQGG